MSQMYGVTLKKVSSNRNALRTKSVSGSCAELPIVEHRFIMIAKSLTEGKGFRKVTTSPVKRIIKDTGREILFETVNTVYELKVKHG